MTNSTDWLDGWRAHVHTATGRTLADDERCPCGAVLEDGAPWCSYEHYLKYDLVNEADAAVDGDRAEVEQPAERDALPSLPAAGPESVAVLLGTIERLRTAHQASSTLAEAVAGIGHIIFDELDDARAEVERLRAERDRLAAEVEQLHARIEGNLHALADAFIEEGVRLASVDQLDAELSERLERLASKAQANFDAEGEAA